MIEWIASILLLAGAGFILLSSVGLLRFPDLYTRMHATTKASALGMLFLVTGICISVPSAGMIVKSVFIVLYVFLTSPISSHVIGSAGHMRNVPKWKHTFRDDLEEDREKTQTHT